MLQKQPSPPLSAKQFQKGLQLNRLTRRLASEKVSRRQFSQPGFGTKIAEGRAGFLGRPKKNRVFRGSQSEGQSVQLQPC